MAPSPKPDRAGNRLQPRRVRTDLLVLGSLCAVLFFLWPTTHGLTNWQEGIRALAASDMDTRGTWITPTVHGQPYLAKPPMVYWLQLALAQATGSTVSVLHLRLVVAIAASLGVALTYLAGRRILRDPALDASPTDDANGSRAWADHAAFWAAAMLATGILYARSGRIGELDILLVPFVVGGAWAGFEAWRSHLERKRTHWPAVAALMCCAAGATLTKGPPGAMVLFFAACMGPALQQLTRLVRAPGVGPFKELFVAWSRMHPIGLALVAGGSLWGWGRLVAADIGADAVRTAASAEAADNLRFFVADAPLNNLEASAYGVGLGSITAIIALVWLIKDRPKLPIGAWVIAAWLGLTMIAMSVLGKGVPRYLTPVWPAIALLGGMWLASARRDLRIGPVLVRITGVLVVILAIGQGVWYGIGREHFSPERSPRDLIAQLLETPGIEPDNLVAIDFWHPAVDVYAGQLVEPYMLCGPETSFTIGTSSPLEALRTRAADHPLIALIRESQPPNSPSNRDLPPPIDLLRAHRFTVEPIDTPSGFRIDSLRTRVRGYWVSADRTAVRDPGG